MEIVIEFMQSLIKMVRHCRTINLNLFLLTYHLLLVDKSF
nr:MAG TPA: hypothetical protein [Caudoviricetes sp.]